MSNEQGWFFGGDDAVIGVLLEARQGHTADEVAQMAREQGASDVVALSTGVVSATGARRLFEALRTVAEVRPKPTSGLRVDGIAPPRTCHNRAHSDRPASALIMGYWWCDECYQEANELT